MVNRPMHGALVYIMIFFKYVHCKAGIYRRIFKEKVYSVWYGKGNCDKEFNALFKKFSEEYKKISQGKSILNN